MREKIGGIPDGGHGASGPTQATARHAAFLLFSTALLGYVFTAGGSLTSTDAVITFKLTESLVTEGSTALPYQRATPERSRGLDGRLYSRYGIGQSLYNIPFYVAGRALERWMGHRSGKPDMIPKAAVAMASAPAAAACVAVSFLFAWRLTSDASASCFAALALGFSSLLWPYSKFGFNAPLAALLLLASTYTLWIGTRLRNDRSLVWAGVLFGCGWLTRHELVLGLIPATLWLAVESGSDFRLLRHRLLRLAPGVIAGGALWGTYNAVRFGSPFDVGHSPVFGTAGFYGYFFSPGGSLFLYSPIVVAGIVGLIRLASTDRNTALLLGGQAITFTCFFASLDDWFGGRSYGPRYLVPILPFLCVPLAVAFVTSRRGTGTRLLVLLALASSLLQLPGVLVDYSKVVVEYVQSGAHEPLRERMYSWDSSALVLNARAVWRGFPQNVRYLAGVETPRRPIGEPGSSEQTAERHLAFSIDFWWLLLFYLGFLPRNAALVLGALQLVAALVVAQRFRRSLLQLAQR